MTDEERKKKLAKQEIERAKQQGFEGSVEEYIENITNYLAGLDYGMTAEVSEYIRSELKRYDDDIFLNEGFATLSQRHDLWLLPETLEKFGNNYWNVYKENVRKNLHLSETDIEELRDNSLEIINKLVQPLCPYAVGKADDYQKKGLVYGNVQSGKTASMGAVISQYATVGCCFIIVLSGIHNNLWLQTQNRLRRDLDIDGQGGEEKLSWKLVTDTSDGIPADKTSLFSDIGGNKNRVIGVFKKNSVVLEKLLTNYLKENEDHFSFLSNISVLIIDDECDQAGIDVSPSDREERSRINSCIVRLFKRFPRYAYVGYTATPFANVLNEKPGTYSMYPEDFISMLPEKEKYFSAAKIFGLGEEFESYEEHDRPTLKVLQLFEPKNKAGIDEEAISEALIYFCLATAAKRLRAEFLGDDKLLMSHSTMMIHTSGKINDHKKTAERVGKIIERMKKEWKEPAFQKGIRTIWQNVYVNNKQDNFEAVKNLFKEDIADYYIPSSFEEVVIEAEDVLHKIEVRIDNSQADPKTERLCYDNPINKTDYYVAVGGNTLSRGLTLEGLIVAVFARKARTYDTLLQMGRWFGYHGKYEDLVRLWVTPEVKDKMRFLSGVELDLRDTIEQYKYEETPLTLAVAIRTRPHMQIVRRLAMKDAKKASINYVGRHPQTIYFTNDHAWLQSNINAVKTLIKKNQGMYAGPVNDGYLFEDVSSQSVSEFLEEYNFDKNTNGLSSKLLLEFKKKAEENEYITSWNVVVKTIQDGKHIDETIIPGISLKLLERGKLPDSNENRIYLKAIASSGDIVCDIPGAPGEVKNKKNSEKFKYRENYYAGLKVKTPGLLVIYPIYAKSKAKSKDRLDLNAENDVYGISIIFPRLGNKNFSKYYESVSIELEDVKEIEGGEYADGE